MSYTIAAFYRFAPIESPPAFRQALSEALDGYDILGTLLIAPEGINGTLAGSEAAIDHLLDWLNQNAGLPRGDVKFSHSPEKPFHRLKLRLKKEIITFNQPGVDPHKTVGKYVEPQDWNSLIDDPDVLVLDTRNRYETDIGVFRGAECPGIETFTDFAAYVRTRLDAAKHRKIAMYCTGGIRCEKASSFLLQEGFAEVYHLKGGILRYLEQTPPETSKWQGECYVFDRRMSVAHGLKPGSYSMCFSCGEPLSDADKRHPQFEEGVACGGCYEATNDSDKARFRTRHRQITHGEVQA